MTEPTIAEAPAGMNRLRSRPAPQPIVLTSHPRAGSVPPIAWGAATAAERGPVIATLTDPAARNAIGTHSGAYSLYRALAVASGQLDPAHRPDFENTRPADPIGPFAQWGDPAKIVSLDPWGHLVPEVFAAQLAAGRDIRPSIAVTRAHMNMPELREAMEAGRLSPDGAVLAANGDLRVTKIAIEPVWWLPGVAARFGIGENALRRSLFEQTGGMFPELVTRPDLRVFLPPIGGMTVYLFGDPAKLGDPNTKIAARIHDECNGSDVFGSDICTCRPYLAHGIEVCARMAQAGGVGVIVYNRKEGRALGEVTKFLVYNARKRQEGGDRAESYFLRTECVAGVQDMRFQELMPDVLHWLGIARIDQLVSMSNMKHAPIVSSGIEVVERIPIPDGLIPADAQVEMDAKKAAGYFTDRVPEAEELRLAKGRGLEG
ncbi:GTP cyclohydrolase II [Muricoccus radiodurans]|uniref:GTP cyclohydrolase II n=1 Tax=Muricoccus radiodurans TaxID=2231721 RepID=UPI003CED2225